MFYLWKNNVYFVYCSLKVFTTYELDMIVCKSSLLMKCPPFQHDKERLSVCSHFSWLDDDEVLIRKGPCQINLKKTPTKSLPLCGMTRQLSGIGKKVKPNFFVAGTDVLNTLRHQGLTQNVKCRKTLGIMSVLDHNLGKKLSYHDGWLAWNWSAQM